MGSHPRPVMKLKPNRRIDGIECAASATIIAPTIRTISSATLKIKARKIASPVLPVGESLRRQCVKDAETFRGGRRPPFCSFISMCKKGGQRPPLNNRGAVLLQRLASGRYRIDFRF